jgi:hypothetical protein
MNATAAGVAPIGTLQWRVQGQLDKLIEAGSRAVRAVPHKTMQNVRMVGGTLTR